MRAGISNFAVNLQRQQRDKSDSTLRLLNQIKYTTHKANERTKHFRIVIKNFVIPNITLNIFVPFHFPKKINKNKK